jgi:hypothetical protein
MQHRRTSEYQRVCGAQWCYVVETPGTVESLAHLHSLAIDKNNFGVTAAGNGVERLSKSVSGYRMMPPERR